MPYSDRHIDRKEAQTGNFPNCFLKIGLYFDNFTCVSYAEACNRYKLDVRPSVRLSVTRWYCIKKAEHIVMLSSPHDSPFILVLCISRSSRNSDGVTRDSPRGVPRGDQYVQTCAKIATFGFYGLNYWETVEDRCVKCCDAFDKH